MILFYPNGELEAIEPELFRDPEGIWARVGSYVSAKVDPYDRDARRDLLRWIVETALRQNSGVSIYGCLFYAIVQNPGLTFEESAFSVDDLAVRGSFVIYDRKTDTFHVLPKAASAVML